MKHKYAKKFLSVSIAAFAGVLVTACTSNHGFLPRQVERDPQVVASPDRVSLMLAEAADKASNALETLAAVEQSRAPAIAVQPIHNAPPELQRAITINWIGPADQLLKKLADRASYSFINVGDKPPVPLVVNIDVENKQVIDVLRDTGLQLGTRADVKVDSIRKMIELHYAPVTGLGS
ncbi:MAG: DotD/TraH family lipoprotein [Pseudomonadota bacterium]